MNGILLGGRGRVRAYPEAQTTTTGGGGGGGGGGVPSGVFIYPNAKRADSVFFTPSAHWKFADGAGAVAADSSTNANNLTLNAPYAWVAGGAPNGVDPSLQLSNGFATTPLSAARSKDFSLWIETNPINLGWTAFLRIKPAAAASFASQLIIRKQTQPGTFDAGSWLLGIFGTGGGPDTGKIVFAVQGGVNLVSSTAIDDGVWHDVVVIVDRSRVGEHFKMYIDGALENTTATIGGGSPDAANHEFDLRNEATGGELSEIAEMAILPFAIPTTVPALLWNGGGGNQRRLDDTATGLIEIAKV